jgi:hypothetical protein
MKERLPKAVLFCERLPESGVLIMAATRWPVFTGCASSSVLGSKSPSGRFARLIVRRPGYPSDDPRRIADIPSRGRLWSSATNQLGIRPARLKIGERAFASAGPLIWNSQPDDIINGQSLPVFRRKLKAHLF